MSRYSDDREQALEEIRKAMAAEIKALVAWARDYMRDKEKLTLPDHMRIRETFRLRAAIMHAARDLKQGKPLKDAFARVSARYQSSDPGQVLGFSDDLAPSPAAKTDGRLSAFEDMMKILAVAERDLGLEPMGKETQDFWRRRYPLDSYHLESAWRQNQRRFTARTLKDTRGFLEGLRDRPAGPKPPTP